MCFFTDILNTRYSSESENDHNFQEMMSINILRLSAIIVTWNETISDFTGDKVTGQIPFEGNAEFPSEASENKDVILFPFKFRDLLHTRRGSIGNLWTGLRPLDSIVSDSSSLPFDCSQGLLETSLWAGDLQRVLGIC